MKRKYSWKKILYKISNNKFLKRNKNRKNKRSQHQQKRRKTKRKKDNRKNKSQSSNKRKFKFLKFLNLRKNKKKNKRQRRSKLKKAPVTMKINLWILSSTTEIKRHKIIKILKILLQKHQLKMKQRSKNNNRNLNRVPVMIRISLWTHFLTIEIKKQKSSKLLHNRKLSNRTRRKNLLLSSLNNLMKMKQIREN